jgi:hypothetical protein
MDTQRLLWGGQTTWGSPSPCTQTPHAQREMWDMLQIPQRGMAYPTHPPGSLCAFYKTYTEYGDYINTECVCEYSVVCGITLMQHWSTECACMPISSRHFIIGNRKEQHIQLYRSKVKLINRLRLGREFWKAANVSHKSAGVNTGILPEKR